MTDFDAGNLAAEGESPPGFRIEPRLVPLRAAGHALRFVSIPLIVLWFFPGPEEGRDLILGLNLPQVAMALMFILTSYFAHGYWKYLRKLLRLGGSLVIIDSEGIYCKERRRLFRWEDMFSVNAIRGWKLFSASRLNLTYREVPASDDGRVPASYASYSWRLDGTDVDAGCLHGEVCGRHRRAVPPDQLFQL